MNTYSKLIPQIIPQIFETPHSYECLTERHLQAMWLEQKYFRPLHTIDDRPIIVLSPGIWNSDAGPDFLNSHLLIGNEEFRGDIELHLTEDSWYHHHHDNDPRYDAVVLHISFWEIKQESTLLTSKGRSLTRTQLKPFLTVPVSRLIKLIDLDLYPYQHFTGSGYCSQHLFKELSTEKTTHLLQSAAHWRFEQKLDMLEEKIPSPDRIGGGLSMILGYKHNAEAFIDIFLTLKSLKSQPQLNEHTLLANALGISGFFQPHHHQKWMKSTYYNFLRTIFYEQTHTNHIIQLRLDRVRPANHPVRRLAIVAKICLDPTIEMIPSKIINSWESLWNSRERKKWNLLRHQLFELVPQYEDPYWNVHYTFETDPQPNSFVLIGEDVKKEILFNLFLPILYQNINQRDNHNEYLAFQEFFASLPASKTKKSTYLTHRFFGDTSKEHLLDRADLQQGAYQIHRDFCIHFEASCIGCPFVENVRESVLGIPEEENVGRTPK